ncbi:MAG: glutamate--tRNA ligase family protein [Bryobacteraceae bacterium]
MLRVRFAPSPTGYLHIGSARTFIFNWLYARHNGGTMILRIDDTDVERNTQESLDSIFDGLKWLDLGWDEFYRQSERLDLHARAAETILAKGLAYRDSEGVVRYRVPRDTEVTFTDLVYGVQTKATEDIEDFALLRSNGVPTYHLASCADDADLKISHIIRGQDHLTNTFKHVLIFEALGVEPPKFAHLPLLIAPDGSKLSKRKHGPVVSVTTYRDAGFLAQSFVNFLCLLGWSPKNDREKMSREELVEVFTLEGVNKSNATVNFTEEDPFDPKALWLNAEHLKALPIEELAADLLPFMPGASLEKMLAVAPLIQERIKTLRDVTTVGDFFFVDELAPYPIEELIPQKGDLAMARTALEKSREVLASVEFNHDALDSALRAAALELKIKPGQMFQPIRVAVCGRKNSPPLFETLVVLGREMSLKRIEEAIKRLA